MTLLHLEKKTQRARRPDPAAGAACSAVLGVLLAILSAAVSAQVQPQLQTQQATITPAFRDADLTQIIDAVSTITGKTFIIDPRVRAQVTILSSTPMTPDAFYQAFLSILQVHGFIAVPSGDVIKIVPEANQRMMPSNDLPDHINPNSDEIVTQVIALRNVNAAQLVPLLRPMVPQSGHLVSAQGSNMLIISDRAGNVSRLMHIIARIDQSGDQEIDIVRLENASAGEIVRAVNTLFGGAGGGGAPADGGAAMAKVVADDRTNSILITGEKSQRLRIRTLIAHLDTPREGGGDTQVLYLRYADAEALAGKLKEQVTGIVQAAGGAPGSPATSGPAAADRSVTIWADKQNNALVITAPPKIMAQIKTVVDKLDIRRLQVLVEAILVEVSASKVAELGVNWAIDGTSSAGTVPIGTFNQTVGGSSIGSIAAAIRDPETLATTGLPEGLTLGAGRFLDSGTNFAMILRALRGDSNTNILQTPSIITIDNEEAEIKVAQEIPFVTGQFTNTGASNGSVNPFQTIQREEVGTILKITPQINEGDSVMLKIEQESSGVTQGPAGAVDLVTNKRTISTNVMVDDGGVIVLGGLISDTALEGENRVPLLGAIPIIGEFFKTRSGKKEKQNLMVFIRPTILRDSVDAAIETNAKYNVLRNQQLARRKGRVTLLPGERQPLLPPIEELSTYADPTAGAEQPAPGTDQTKIRPPLETTPAPAPTPPDEEDRTLLPAPPSQNSRQQPPPGTP
jgi:general secretion pathway protein D